jgi:hypothetical protein
MSQRLLIALLYTIAVASMHPTAASAADAIAFKKSPVKLIDTGLENMEPNPGSGKAAVWVDDHRLLAGVPLERSAHDPKRIGRTVIYDLNTGKARELMRYAHPLCWDAKTGQAIVAAYPNPDDSTVWRTLGLKVNQSADILERRDVDPLSWNVISCDTKGADADPSLRERRIAPLRTEHGYVDLGPKGKPMREAPVIYRPDGTKNELSLKAREINGLRYLDFLGKYQLNTGSGCNNQGWQCPPDIYLLNQFGELAVIPIPNELMTLIPIQQVDVVRDGLLFRATSTDQHEGYFVLRGGTLHQLWRPGPPGFMKLGRTEIWGGQSISPDGCKVAFRRGASPSRVYVFDHCAVGR